MKTYYPMIKVEFINKNFEKKMYGWEKWMEMGWRKGVLTDCNETMAKGLFFSLDLENGLGLVMGDYVAKDDITFINKAYTADNNFFFTLNYLVMGDVYIPENENKRKKEGKKHTILSKSVLHHSKSNFSFITQKEKRVRALDIVFSHEWLLSQFAISQRHAISASIKRIENFRSFYIDNVSVKAIEFVKEVLDKVFYEEWNTVFLKTRILYLIEEFISSNILQNYNKQEKATTDESLIAMLEIKQRINDSLYKKIPKESLGKRILYQPINIG